MPAIETLVEDIYKILDEDTDHVVDETNVEWAGEAFKALLRKRLQERKGSGKLRFSSLGKPDRKLWYDVHQPEKGEKLQPKQVFKFLYGDVIEVLMLFLAKEAKHEVSHEQYLVSEDGIEGHMDAVIDGVPVDCKSASSYSYQKFMSGDFLFDDPFGYIRQLSGYSHKVDKTDRAAFFVADKVHGDLGLAWLDGMTIKANPPGPRIAHQKEMLAKDTPPPRCYSDVPEGKSGNMKLGIACSYCAHKTNCWSDANDGAGLRQFFYSRGPVWLTKVVKEPRVVEAG